MTVTVGCEVGVIMPRDRARRTRTSPRPGVSRPPTRPLRLGERQPGRIATACATLRSDSSAFRRHSPCRHFADPHRSYATSLPSGLTRADQTRICARREEFALDSALCRRRASTRRRSHPPRVRCDPPGVKLIDTTVGLSNTSGSGRAELLTAAASCGRWTRTSPRLVVPTLFPLGENTALCRRRGAAEDGELFTRGGAPEAGRPVDACGQQRLAAGSDSDIRDSARVTSEDGEGAAKRPGQCVPDAGRLPVLPVATHRLLGSEGDPSPAPPGTKIVSRMPARASTIHSCPVRVSLRVAPREGGRSRRLRGRGRPSSATAPSAIPLREPWPGCG